MKKLVTQPVTKRTVRLSNDGGLSVLFLGTGSAFARRFFQTNFLVIKGDDCLLVDCGTKCSLSLHKLGLGFQDIKNYYISHSHADHIGGLEEVMLVYRYFLQKKPNIYITPTYQKPLWEESLAGGAAHSEKKHKGQWLQFEDFWNVHSMNLDKQFVRETWEAQIGSINIKTPRTCHFPENSTSWKDAAWSTGIIIDDRIFFTCDTVYDYELLREFDEKLDLEWIFHDCQFFPGGIHANIHELNELPEHLKSRTLLCHYGDNMHQYIETAKTYGLHSFTKEHTFYHFDA